MKRIPLIYWFPVLVYYAFITFLSGITPGLAADVSVFPHIDKVYHFVEYTFFGLILARDLFWTQVLHKTKWKWSYIFIPLIAVLAGLDECHQYFTPNRTMDVFDAMTDVIGATFGAAIFVYFIRGRKYKVTTHQELEELKSRDKRYFALCLLPIIFFIMLSVNFLNVKDVGTRYSLFAIQFCTFVEWGTLGYVAHRFVHLFRRKKRMGRLGWTGLLTLGFTAVIVYWALMQIFRIYDWNWFFVAQTFFYFLVGTVAASLKVKLIAHKSALQWDMSFERQTWQRFFQAVPALVVSVLILLLSAQIRKHLWVFWSQNPAGETCFFAFWFFLLGWSGARFFLWEAWWHEASQRWKVFSLGSGCAVLILALSEVLKIALGERDLSVFALAFEAVGLIFGGRTLRFGMEDL